MNRSNISKQLNYGDLSRFVGKPVGQQFAKKRYAVGDTVAEELTGSVTYEDVNGKKRTYRYNPETHTKPQPSGRMRKLGIDYTQLAYNPGINIFDQAEVAVDPVIAQSQQQNTPVSVTEEPFWTDADIDYLETPPQDSPNVGTHNIFQAIEKNKTEAQKPISFIPGWLQPIIGPSIAKGREAWGNRELREGLEKQVGENIYGDPSRGQKGKATVEGLLATGAIEGVGAGEKGWEDATSNQATTGVGKAAAAMGTAYGSGLSFNSETGKFSRGDKEISSTAKNLIESGPAYTKESIDKFLKSDKEPDDTSLLKLDTKAQQQRSKDLSALSPVEKGTSTDYAGLLAAIEKDNADGLMGHGMGPFNNLSELMGGDVGYDHWAGMTGAGPSSGGGAGSSFPDQIGDWMPQSPSGPSWMPQSPTGSPSHITAPAGSRNVTGHEWDNLDALDDESVGGGIDVSDYSESWDYLAKGGIAQLSPGGIAPSDKHLDPGSFVISADVVSGVGDGSTESGIERMSGLLGIPLDGSASGPNGSMLGRVTTADGGPVPGTGLSDSISTVIQDTDTVRLNVGNNPLKQMTPQGKTAARVARDELVVDTKTIANLPQMFMGAKGPDLKQGQQMLTNFMDNVRANKTNTGGKQPGPLVPEGQDVMKGLASLFQRA